jgi:hypothetical protein
MEQSIIEAEAQAVTPQKDFNIDAFIEKRKEFIEKVNKIMVEGKDFHVIQGRKSMAKGGAEKIASIFGWTASFINDFDTLKLLGDPVGLVTYLCVLTKDGKKVGEGRGAADIKKNNGDANKTVKMAQKSAFIDAVIRTSGLSDFYTQDLEDMDPKDIGISQSSQPAPKAPYRSNSGVIQPSKAQYNLISKLMEQKGITKEDLIDQGLQPGTLTGGKDGTASEMIDYLIKAKNKIDPNGDPVEEYPGVPFGDEDLRSP